MEFIELLKESLPSLTSGLLVTIEISVISLIIAVILGIIFGVFSISRSKILKTLAGIYLYIIRGTPLMVQALIIYFGIAPLIVDKTNPIYCAIIALSLNAGAYMSEIFRAGIMAVDAGQTEAARSLGLGYLKTMQKIVIPQAIRVMIPSIINQFIVTIKDTSILTVITIRELTASGQIIVARNFKPLQTYAMVGIMYFILITVLSISSKYIEGSFNHGHKSK